MPVLCRAVCLFWALAFCAVGRAEPPKYPAGDSKQEADGRKFSLRVPAGFGEKERGGLILCMGGVGDFDTLAKEPYVVCVTTPQVDPAGRMWSAGETKEIQKLVDHLLSALPIDPARVHAVGIKEGVHSIFQITTLGEGSRFVSVTFVESYVHQASVAKRAKTGLGVLAFDFQPPGGDGVKKIEEILGGRVRSVELRPDPDGAASPYFKWWIRAMEGRFVPGDDLSFAWIDDMADAAALTKRMGSSGKGALLWFFSAADAEVPWAKALQTTAFLDDHVRAAVRPLLAVKVDRAAQAAWFDSLGLKQTPALVVYGAKAKAPTVFSGEVKTAALLKALEAASH